MEKITITIETANAAFDNAPEEVARILHELADRFQQRAIPEKLRDINGNTCGTVETE